MRIALILLLSSLVCWAQPTRSRAFLGASAWQAAQNNAGGGGGGGGTVGMDVVTVTNTGLTATSLTFAHINHSGTDRYLVVGFTLSENSAPYQTVSSVTYAGTPMTALTNGAPNNDSTCGACYFYGLVNPAAGSNNVIITASGTIDRGIGAGAMTFTNVNQSTPISNITTNWAYTATASLTVASAANDMVADFVCTGSAVGTATGTGHVRQYFDNFDGGSCSGNIGGGTTTGAASTTPGYNVTEDYWFMAAVNLKHN